MVALNRARIVFAENKQRKRELDESRQTQACIKRERVAAILAHKEGDIAERERQLRADTYGRIKREEKRRELLQQRQEDERMERIRLYETERYVPAQPPGVQSARSFFSITGSTVSVETMFVPALMFTPFSASVSNPVVLCPSPQWI